MMATALIAQNWVAKWTKDFIVSRQRFSFNQLYFGTSCCVRQSLRWTCLGMLVFKNGSLSREQVRKEHCDGAWDRWEKMLVTWTRNLNLQKILVPFLLYIIIHYVLYILMYY